jgi:hypothetical protein
VQEGIATIEKAEISAKENARCRSTGRFLMKESAWEGADRLD